MRVEQSSAEELLGELKMLLASDQMPVQEEIATVAGVHQSLVSRAQNGQLKRMTAKVQALLEYARSRANRDVAAIEAVQAIEADASAEPPKPRTAGDREVKHAKRPGNRQVGASIDLYRREALDGVKTYLDDGYDPRLIVEQLAVLRRAQRLRRPGRRPLHKADDQTTGSR